MFKQIFEFHAKKLLAMAQIINYFKRNKTFEILVYVIILIYFK